MLVRPAGVMIFAAVLLGVGGFVFSFAGYTVLHLPPPPVRPCVGMLCGFDWRPLIVPLLGLYIALSLWAIVTGAGLLARREWARRSSLGIVVLAIVGGFLAATYAPTLFLGLGLIGAGSLAAWYLCRTKVKTWFAGLPSETSGRDVAA